MGLLGVQREVGGRNAGDRGRVGGSIVESGGRLGARVGRKGCLGEGREAGDSG